MKSKKVVSIVLNNFQNDHRVLKECMSLRNAGYRVTVVALWEEGLKEFETIEGVQVHRLPLETRKWSKHPAVQIVKYGEFVLKTVRKYRGVDIVHCNDLETLPIGIVIKRLNPKVRVVYDAHEYETERNGLSGMRKRISKVLERTLIKYTDRIITVSASIAEAYVQDYPFIQKPELILNTPVYRRITRKDKFRKEFGIGDDRTIFLYQGALNKGRGIEMLVDTFCKMPQTDHVIVFMGYGVLEKTIREACEDSGNVFFHPAVSPDVLLEYTSSADVGIAMIEDTCLSYRYALPNKMFEYMAAGLPVIVSDLPEMKRIVERYGVGVVASSNDSEGMMKAIKSIGDMDREALQDRLRKVMSIYNWQEQEKKLIELYEKLNQ